MIVTHVDFVVESQNNLVPLDNRYFLHKRFVGLNIGLYALVFSQSAKRF